MSNFLSLLTVGTLLNNPTEEQQERIAEIRAMVVALQHRCLLDGLDEQIRQVCGSKAADLLKNTTIPTLNKTEWWPTKSPQTIIPQRLKATRALLLEQAQSSMSKCFVDTLGPRPKLALGCQAENGVSELPLALVDIEPLTEPYRDIINAFKEATSKMDEAQSQEWKDLFDPENINQAYRKTMMVGWEQVMKQSCPEVKKALKGSHVWCINECVATPANCINTSEVSLLKDAVQSFLNDPEWFKETFEQGLTPSFFEKIYAKNPMDLEIGEFIELFHPIAYQAVLAVKIEEIHKGIDKMFGAYLPILNKEGTKDFIKFHKNSFVAFRDLEFNDFLKLGYKTMLMPWLVQSVAYGLDMISKAEFVPEAQKRAQRILEGRFEFAIESHLLLSRMDPNNPPPGDGLGYGF